MKKLLLATLLLGTGALGGTLLGLTIKNRADPEISKVHFALSCVGASLAIAAAVLGLLFLLAKMLHLPWINTLWLSAALPGLWFLGASTGYWIRRIRNDDYMDNKEWAEFIILLVTSLVLMTTLALWLWKALRDYLRRRTTGDDKYAGVAKRNENIAHD